MYVELFLAFIAISFWTPNSLDVSDRICLDVALLASVHTSAALNGAKALVEWRYFDLEAQLYGDAVVPRNGRIAVPQGPGLGIEPNPDVLRDYRLAL